MTGEMILGLFLIIIGIGAFVSIFHKFKGVPKIHPLLGVILAVVLVGLGASIGGWVDLGLDDTQGTIVNIGDDPLDIEWEITPSAVTTGSYCSDTQLNSAETIFTVPAMANTTAHIVNETDNTSWNDPRLQFEVNPVAPQGATADDLATLKYRVKNPDVTIDSSSDTYYLFTKSGGQRQLKWVIGSSTDYVTGSKTMLLTGNETIYLDLDVNSDSFSRMSNTFDPVTVVIEFYDDSGFSETYSVNFQLTDQFA